MGGRVARVFRFLRETASGVGADGDGLRLVAYASESAPIFTPEFPKADPYQFLEIGKGVREGRRRGGGLKF